MNELERELIAIQTAMETAYSHAAFSIKETKMMTPIQIIYRYFGITQREERLDIMSTICRREIKTFDNLTAAEAWRFIDWMLAAGTQPGDQKFDPRAAAVMEALRDGTLPLSIESQAYAGAETV